MRGACSTERLRLLYVSPERLERFAPELRAAGVRPSLLAVDEAHCIAEWGHDFRPSYRALLAARYRLGRPPAVALTGSATPDVRAEIARALGFSSASAAEHLGSFDRDNLWFGVVKVGSDRERLEALRRLIAGDDRMAIVYAPTRSVTEGVARALAAAGHRAAPYHAGLDRARRAAILDAFLDDRLDVVVATCAFGMGIDKPTVRLVVHWTLPPTPESYYQEAGRAGRDGEFARCVLLWHPNDAALHRRQLDVTFPPRRLVERIWREGAAVTGVPANVRESAARLAKELRPDGGPVDWEPVARRRQRAEARLRAMDQYARGASCRRRALVGYFGERLGKCAGCDRCRTEPAVRPLLPAVGGEAHPPAPGARRQGGAVGRLPAGARCPPPPRPQSARHARVRLPTCPASGPRSPSGTGPSSWARWTCRSCRGMVHSVERRSVRTVESAAAERALEEWRAAVAREMGVPAYVVLGDSALAQLAAGTGSAAQVSGRRQASPRRPAPASARNSMPSSSACSTGWGAPGYFPFDASSLRSMSSTIFFADPSPMPRVSAFTMNRSPTSTTTSLFPSLFHFSNAG